MQYMQYIIIKVFYYAIYYYRGILYAIYFKKFFNDLNIVSTIYKNVKWNIE